MCSSPILLVNPHYKKLASDLVNKYGGSLKPTLSQFAWRPDYKLWVPCGHCLECLSKRRQTWALRAHHLMQRYGLRPDQCVFCTLSINDNNMPRALKDPYAVIRRFIDRIRKHPRFIIGYTKRKKPIYRKVKLHYICVMEFGDGTRAWERGLGESTHRLHYHMVFFGSPLYWWQLRDLWAPFEGFAWNSPLRHFGGVLYTVKYLLKDTEVERTDADGIDRSKNGKLIVSHGFGRLSKKDKQRMRDILPRSPKSWLSYSLNGFNYAIPRYWKTAIFDNRELKLYNKKFVEPLVEKYLRHKFRHLKKALLELKVDFYLHPSKY